MRKFFNDERDARAASSPLYSKWEAIDPENRAMHSDEFFERWLVCTPPSYSTRADGSSDSWNDKKKRVSPFLRAARDDAESRAAAKAADDGIMSSSSDDEEGASHVSSSGLPTKFSLGRRPPKQKWTGSLRPEHKAVPKPACEECEVRDATVLCTDCEQKFCRRCWPLVHRRGSLRMHRDVTLGNDGEPLPAIFQAGFGGEEEGDESPLMKPPKVESVGAAGRRNFAYKYIESAMDNTSKQEDDALALNFGVTPRTDYIKRCKNEKLLTEPTIVRSKFSYAYNRSHFGLGSDKINAQLAHLSKLPDGIEEVDLSDNRLDDETIAKVVDAIRRNPMVRVLRLRRNRVGRKAVQALSELFQSQATMIDDLDLSSTQMEDEDAARLFEAMGSGADSIVRLNVSENALGTQSAKALGRLFEKTKNLSELNLSNNKFGDKAVQKALRGLKSNESVKKLNLQMTGMKDRSASTLGHILRSNATLSDITVAYNMIGNAGAKALGSGIRRNGTLQTLNASHTQITTQGVRDILAAVEVEGSGGDMQRSFILKGLDHGFQKFQEFDESQPTGFYKIDLTSYYERAIVEQLLGRSEKDGSIVWSNVRLNGKPPRAGGTLLQRLHEGVWKIPSKGYLEMRIGVRKGRKLPPTEKVEASVEEAIVAVRGCKTNSRLDMLAKMTARDELFLNKANAQKLMNLFQAKDRSTALLSMMPRLIEHEDAGALAMRNLNKTQQVELDDQVGLIYGFSPVNPTGRYVLDMSDHYQRLVAVRCLEISNDLEKECRELGLPDSSQHGNYMCFRNEKLGGRPMQIHHDQHFGEYGKLTFDFVSTRRPPVQAMPLHEQLFERMKTQIGLKKKGGNNGAAGGASLMKILAASKAAAQWKKKVQTKNLVTPQALLAQKAREKVENMEAKSMSNGLVYTADGRVVKRGAGLVEMDAIIMKLREYIAKHKCYFDTSQMSKLISSLPPKPLGDGIYDLRVELVVALFSRIVDIENFSTVVREQLPENERREITHRLGWLNTFNPYQPTGDYRLCLKEKKIGSLRSCFSIPAPMRRRFFARNSWSMVCPSMTYQRIGLMIFPHLAPLCSTLREIITSLSRMMLKKMERRKPIQLCMERLREKARCMRMAAKCCIVWQHLIQAKQLSLTHHRNRPRCLSTLAISAAALLRRGKLGNQGLMVPAFLANVQARRAYPLGDPS